MQSDMHAKEEVLGIVPSHGISLDIPFTEDSAGRPPIVSHLSSPGYESPLRHHRRQPSTPRPVKETLHARSSYENSEDGGTSIHRINQYIVKQEIGRGSFGAVHLAVDQHGHEYAVKEFSKSRLRKRAQSNILRRPHGPKRPGHLSAGGFNHPLHQHSLSDIHDDEEKGNPLYLIREEIAIMKKLNHNNLVSLIEVLDDPSEDSLYMVQELCKKGVIMKVGMNERADPYDSESCRCWFRDLILGIEYLHAQGIIHRDIKPDNLLLTEDDILKIVDFGVSEMFEKHSDMKTAKSAGSPAFLPPELCVSHHGGVSGKAADIWSMGVTLYCLYFGRIPFEKFAVLDLYESIKQDELQLPDDCPEDLEDLMHKILDKDPSRRIAMPELREHPWVTKHGADPLLSAEENTAELIEPPTQEEINRAISGNLSNLVIVMKAVNRFKGLLNRRRPYLMNSILGQGTRMVQPPLAIDKENPSATRTQTRSVDVHNRKPIASALVMEGVHRETEPNMMDKSEPSREDSAVVESSTRKDSGHSSLPGASPSTPKRAASSHSERHRSRESTLAIDIPKRQDSFRGHAHDPLEDYLFLDIGPEGTDDPHDPPAVAESPPATDVNIYETAYHEEIERIRAEKGRQATLYLTRRVDGRKEYQEDENLRGLQKEHTKEPTGFAKLLQKVKDKHAAEEQQRREEQGTIRVNDYFKSDQ